MKRRIIWYGEKILSQPSEDVLNVDDEIKKLIEDMFDTMKSENGVGLAAVQIGVPKRVVVLSIPSGDEEKPIYNLYCLINPKIVSHSDEMMNNEEGCLSFPDIRINIPRYKAVTVEYMTENGEKKTMTEEGFFAIVLQHEIDHINGVVFVDRLEEHHKKRIKSELRALRKEALKRAGRYDEN